MIDIENSNKKDTSTIWNEELSIRLKNILHFLPITRLKDTRVKNEELEQSYKSFDPLSIATLMIHLVLDEMGAHQGITEEELFERILPFFQSVDRKIKKDILPESEYRKVFNKILHNLNFEDQVEPPRETYTDYSNNIPVENVQYIRVLEKKTFGDSIIIHATGEIVNIFLQLLGTNIEDRMAANNLILNRQIKRGDFRDALSTALNNKRLTQQYSIEVDTMMQNIIRDPQSRNWEEDEKTLSGYFEHIEQTLNEITKHKEKLETFRDSDIFEKRDEESIAKNKDLFELIQIIKDSLELLLPLQNLIFRYNTTHRQKKWLLLFQKKSFNFPNFETSVFKPFLASPLQALDTLFPPFLTYFSKPETPSVLTFGDIVRLCRPKDVSEEEIVRSSVRIVGKLDLEKLKYSSFSKETIALAEEVYKKYCKLHSNSLFSEFVNYCIENNYSKDVANYIRVKLQMNLISEHPLPEYKAEFINTELISDWFFGNDIKIHGVVDKDG